MSHLSELIFKHLPESLNHHNAGSGIHEHQPSMQKVHANKACKPRKKKYTSNWYPVMLLHHTMLSLKEYYND